MKTTTAFLLRAGQSLIRGGRKQRICSVDADRLGTGLLIKLRDGSRILLAHDDRCNVFEAPAWR